MAGLLNHVLCHAVAERCVVVFLSCISMTWIMRLCLAGDVRWRIKTRLRSKGCPGPSRVSSAELWHPAAVKRTTRSSSEDSVTAACGERKHWWGYKMADWLLDLVNSTIWTDYNMKYELKCVCVEWVRPNRGSSGDISFDQCVMVTKLGWLGQEFSLSYAHLSLPQGLDVQQMSTVADLQLCTSVKVLLGTWGTEPSRGHLDVPKENHRGTTSLLLVRDSSSFETRMNRLLDRRFQQICQGYATCSA